MDNISRKTDCETSMLFPGHFVWVKWTHSKWWPAMTISPSDCGHPSPKMGHVWVFWFGGHKISPIASSHMRSFTSCFSELFKIQSGKLRLKAIMETLKVLNSLMEHPLSGSDDDLVQWACQGFPHLPMESVETLPPLVLKYLSAIKDRMEVTSDSETSEDEDLGESLREQLQCGMFNIRDLCLSCYRKNKVIAVEHPFFVGGLCPSCQERLKETVFAIGNDGKNFCCIICAEPGYLILCDNLNCSKSYCRRCIRCYLGPEETAQILQASPWNCFFCVSTANKSSILQVQDEWERKVFSLFAPQCTVNSEVCLVGDADKRPMIVLSLFDGIGTGKLVLDMLGIAVEKYYAVEIDEDSMNVSKMNHVGSITYLGDIHSLTDDVIESLGSIDLVMGGSPCNDLSLVNPARKGILDTCGTGCLFFDFFHVLSVVRRRNRDVFYLFENVAAMRLKDKKTISSFLGQEPAVMDAKHFSPQTRTRFFWGNIPGLHSLSDFWRSPGNYELKQSVLSECLMPIKGRKAVVEKIRTVTTNRNSLFQDKYFMMPVTMHNEPDVLWVTELERVFGFPLHYTDTGNIGIVKRRELLGRAWSVPVIHLIFQSLTHLFLRIE